MSIETEDVAMIVEENTSDKEMVSNYAEVNQLDATKIDEDMPIENSCSVDSTINKMNCEKKNTKRKVCQLNGIPIPEWEKNNWEIARKKLRKGYALGEENTNDKEMVSNDVEVNLSNATKSDEDIPPSCSIISTINKMDCDEEITKKEVCLLDGIPILELAKGDDWMFLLEKLREVFSLDLVDRLKFNAEIQYNKGVHML